MQGADRDAQSSKKQQFTEVKTSQACQEKARLILGNQSKKTTQEGQAWHTNELAESVCNAGV